MLPDLMVDQKPANWKPFPGSPQERAYNSDAHEIVFGGSAGAGKTALGIGLAITKHRRSLILRRQAVNVVEIVDQLKRFVGSAGWRGLGHGGMMRTKDGRVVEVGGCEHEDDKEKYQGRPHDLIVFDEAVHFSQSQFRFISAWNRHENPEQPCRILLPTNPPTRPEGRWIVEEFAPWLDNAFANPATPGDLRWYTMLEGKLTWVDSGQPFTHNGELIKPRSRTFIPGKLADNPILAAGDYGAKLQALPEPLRSQLLYGDFSAGLEDDPWQVVPTEWVRLAMARWTTDPPKGIPQTALGVDVARGGKDKTAIAERRGPWFAALRKYPGSETPDGPIVAALVIQSHRDDSIINVDVIGIGSSVFDCLRGHHWLKVAAINNAGATGLTDRSGKLHFTNIRAASWWKLREALEPAGEQKLMLPPDNELLTDLCAPRYRVLASGIQIEPKEDIVERIGRSPDCGDAVVLAHWEGYRKIQPLRIFPLGRATKGPRCVFCSLDDLRTLQIDQPTLLTILRTPPIECSPDWVEPAPAHALTKLAGMLDLAFAELNPADHQSSWTANVPPWELPCEKLMLTRDIGKKLWGWLTRRRDPVPEVYVFAAEVDAVGQSVAMAVADTLNLPREALWSPTRPEWKATREDRAPNQYVYEMTKKCRALVV